jgi:hypothetical protein
VKEGVKEGLVFWKELRSCTEGTGSRKKIENRGGGEIRKEEGRRGEEKAP